MSCVKSFFQKHNVYLFAGAIWQYDTHLKVSTIVFPNYHNRIRTWESEVVEAPENHESNNDESSKRKDSHNDETKKNRKRN